MRAGERGVDGMSGRSGWAEWVSGAVRGAAVEWSDGASRAAWRWSGADRTAVGVGEPRRQTSEQPLA